MRLVSSARVSSGRQLPGLEGGNAELLKAEIIRSRSPDGSGLQNDPAIDRVALGHGVEYAPQISRNRIQSA
jgi:hypothetical protein